MKINNIIVSTFKIHFNSKLIDYDSFFYFILAHKADLICFVKFVNTHDNSKIRVATAIMPFLKKIASCGSFTRVNPQLQYSYKKQIPNILQICMNASFIVRVLLALAKYTNLTLLTHYDISDHICQVLIEVFLSASCYEGVINVWESASLLGGVVGAVSGCFETRAEEVQLVLTLLSVTHAALEHCSTHLSQLGPVPFSKRFQSIYWYIYLVLVYL